tara:strand:- start:1255 stop:2685 length:1431 start_codon:yes stop_codon:yes gene_type:complete
MQHFYDGQIRRYLTQIVRIFGQFSYKDGKGALVQVPVTYGDLTRQVGSILRDNSENKIPSAPRMAIYITGIEMDTTRLSDSSYINKLNIRERALNAAGDEYLNSGGKNYTVERLMPTPYTLSVNVDIWTTNTDQKLQLLEQIAMLFNPSLEIQTSDNYIDWTSLSVLNLDNINWSSRSIPTGSESEIDVASISLKTPIFISPPAKVKKLGVITKIITAVFADNGLEVNINEDAYAQSFIEQKLIDGDETTVTLLNRSSVALGNEDALIITSYQNYDLVIIAGVAKLMKNGIVNNANWTGWFVAQPFTFEAGITELRLQRANGLEIVGTISVNPNDESELLVNVDAETLPDDSVITGPNGSRTSIDYIIDPARFDPRQVQDSSSSTRLLLLGNIGSDANNDGALAWKNNNNTDFVASENDIIEWDGNSWHIVFDASTILNEMFVTNLNTQTQYKWTGYEWILSYEGEYPNGTWRIAY